MSFAFIRGALAGGLVVSAVLLCSQACRRDAVRPDATSVDDGVLREEIQTYVDRGVGAIPDLRQRITSADPSERRCAKVALARITGQWGGDGNGILWKRSVDEAVGQEKPILVLQLFGHFDKEFC